MTHPTPIEIEEHVRTKEGGAIRAHLEACVDCAAKARSIAALGDPLTWEIADLPDPDALNETLSANGAERPAVLQRVDEAERLRHVDPGAAVRICDDVLALPECSPESEEGRHVAVLALRERANALRVLGRLEDALATVARARELANDLLVSEFENAVLDYIDATILFERQELDGLVELGRRAEATFTRFGDHERAYKARILIAGVAHKRGQYDVARSLYLQLLDSMEDSDNLALKAGLLHNLAGMEVLDGKFLAARTYSGQAAELYRSLGMTTELTRLKWTDARMALGTQDLETAELLFLDAESEFKAEGLDLDAALVSLEIVELYEAQGRRDEVVEIATRLATVFAEAGTRMSLATALATLRDAAVHGEDVNGPILAARTSIEALMEA